MDISFWFFLAKLLWINLFSAKLLWWACSLGSFMGFNAGKTPSSKPSSIRVSWFLFNSLSKSNRFEADMSGVFLMFPNKYLRSGFWNSLFVPCAVEPVIDFTAISTLGIANFFMAVKIVSCMRFSTVVSALVTAWLYLASSPEIRVRSFRELPGLCCHSLYCIIFRHRRQPATLPVEWRLWRQRRRPVFWGVVQVLVHIFVPCAASIQLSLLQVLAHMVCRSLYTQRFVFF